MDQVASDTRSRMQTVQLHSDMCAFKAANPRALFADFLRWFSPTPALFSQHHVLHSLTPLPPRYSPRDFICDQLEDHEDDGGVVPALGNSSVLGLDVPEGAGAVLADVTNAKQTDS